jgi:hypothetical protein
MSYAALPAVTTDFYTSYVNAHPLPVPGANYQQTINMFQKNSPNAATVYVGTFNLKDRVQTWQSHAAELTTACSTKHRIKRAVVTLLGVAIITAGIAAMVFGGDIAWLVGAAAILLFTYFARKPVGKEFFGNGSKHDVLFTAVVPIFFFAMATYESRRAKKLASSKQEAVAIANYVLAKHGDIGLWLEQQRKETLEKVVLEKNNLCLLGVNSANDRVTLGVMQACLDDLDKIEGWTKNLAESVTYAQAIPAVVLAG